MVKINVNVVKLRPSDWITIDVNSISIVPKSIIFNMILINHGTAKQTNISNMLEPIELQSAISTRPARFTTSTLLISSGIEVPAANIVKPPNVSGNRKVLAKKYLPIK